MRCIVFVIFIFLSISSAARGAEVNESALVEALHLPTPPLGIRTADLGLRVGHKFRLDAPDSSEIPKLIAAELTAGSLNEEDFQHYLRLADLYNGIGDKQKEKEANAKAIEHARRALRVKPGDLLLCSEVGGLLLQLGEVDEAESVLRRAIKSREAPWQAWASLGDVLVVKAVNTLLAGNGQKLDPKEDSRTQLSAIVLPLITNNKVTRESAATSQRAANESQACYVRAIKTAREEPDAYMRRAGNRIVQSNLQAVLEYISADHDLPLLFPYPKAAFEDIENAARARPDDIDTQLRCLLFEIDTIAKNKPESIESDAQDLQIALR